MSTKPLAVLLGVLLCFVASTRVEALEDTVIYLAIYGIATRPSDTEIIIHNRNVSQEMIQGNPGLGLKIGLFPGWFHGWLGMELESLGNNNSLEFDLSSGNGGRAYGESDHVTYHSMINLVLR